MSPGPFPLILNPFSTAAVRPGALPYRFPDGAEAESLIDRLAEQNWWGQIVGPHGSGKSTLLHSLLPLVRPQRQVEWFTLNSGQRRLPVSRVEQHRWTDNTLVVVDGYEQLSWWHRTRLRVYCRRRGCGLLVTSHADAGFVTIYMTTTSCEITGQLVEDLMENSHLHLGKEQVGDAFDKCQGNVRETFFKLYDLYELQRSNRA